MGKTLKLNPKQIDAVSQLPEEGMGYHVVNIVLNNGEILNNRVIVNSTFLQLNDGEELTVGDIDSFDNA